MLLAVAAESDVVSDAAGFDRGLQLSSVRSNILSHQVTELVVAAECSTSTSELRLFGAFPRQLKAFRTEALRNTALKLLLKAP